MLDWLKTLDGLKPCDDWSITGIGKIKRGGKSFEVPKAWDTYRVFISSVCYYWGRNYYLTLGAFYSLSNMRIFFFMQVVRTLLIFLISGGSPPRSGVFQLFFIFARFGSL